MSTQNNSNKPSRQNELGAIWKKTSATGTVFYSGKITVNGKDIQIVMFQNDYKQPESREPDWRIFESTASNKGVVGQTPKATAPEPVAAAPQQQRKVTNQRPATPPPVETSAAPSNTL